MNFTEQLINEKIINLHTAFIGKVIGVNDNTARVVPLTYSKNISGVLKEQTPVSARIPQNIKVKRKDIMCRVSDNTSETTTVIVPDELVVGDIVFCGVSERDITSENIMGKTIEPTRHHDINDAVVLAVL